VFHRTFVSSPVVPVDGDVDGRVVASGPPRPVVRPDRAVGRERSRPRDLHPDPGALQPGRLARVVEIDTVVHADQVALAQESLQVVGCGTAADELPTRDDTRLQPQ
jgi:hypothetical protein